MIQKFADLVVYGLLGLDPASRLAESLNFFIYDTLKIILLLLVVSIDMGLLNAYFPTERLRRALTTRRLYGLQYLLASLFGAVTPFCSCSSIPLFIGFVKGGIPLGVTFAFLITSPLVNEIAVAMFLGSFGLKATVIYVVSGITLGTLGGYILGRMRLERHLSPWVLALQAGADEQSAEWDETRTPFAERLRTVVRDAWGIVRGVLLYVVVGIGIGAAMHGYVPEGFFERFMGRDNIFAVPMAVICAVPMYANAAGIDIIGDMPMYVAHDSADVWAAREHPGLRGQRGAARHGHRLHDGGCGAVAARGDDAQEGDDVAAHRHLLRHRDALHHPLGLPLQPAAVTAARVRRGACTPPRGR